MAKEKSPERLTYEANCNEKRSNWFVGLFALSAAAAIGSFAVRNLGACIISTIATGASPIASYFSGRIADIKDARSTELSQGKIDTDLIFDAHIFTRRNRYRPALPVDNYFA